MTQRGSGALAVIEAAIASLRQQPNQFQLTVNATGLSGSASAPGATGMTVVAQGGGPGSNTTGVSVGINTGDVQMLMRRADEALTQQAERAVGILGDIRALLQAPKADKAAIIGRLKALGGTFIAPAVKAVIEAAVKYELGI